MRGWVVFESMFGNTHAVAERVAEGLREHMVTEVFEVGTAPAVPRDGLDLLVVGAPTHRFGLSRPGSRLEAGRQRGDPVVSRSKGLREWVREQRAGPGGPVVAAFSTCVDPPVWVHRLGTSGGVATALLRRRGFTVASRPATFFVTGMTGPLREGEEPRAHAWAIALAVRVAARHGRHAA